MPPVEPSEFAAQRNRVRAFIESLGQTPSANDKARGVSAIILNTELEAQSRFLIVDGLPHIFTRFGRRLLLIDARNAHWNAHLLMVYGILGADRELAPRVTGMLASYALWNGVKMVPRRWTAYVDGALYLTQYDGTVRKLTGAGVTEGPNSFLIDNEWPSLRNDTTELEPISYEIEDNCTNVLFADDDAGSVPIDPVVGRHGHLFRLLRGVSWAPDTVSGMRPHHQVQAMMIWMMALAFPDLFPTKPVIMIEGAPGSGKSMTLQMIQQALFGEVEPFTVTENGERDFWVSMLTSPIMVLDNTDDLIKWLPDQLNAYVTRGYRKERRLHTNTGHVVLRPQSFIAIASQDPKSFRRGDTADRMLVLRMNRRRAGDSARDITTRIANMRALIYGEWLYYLNRVVAALRREPPRRTTSRLGDFEVFAYAACRAFGWQSTVVVPALMAVLNRERSMFAAETDVVLDIVHDWLKVPTNEGRALTIRDLFRDLSLVAAASNKPFVKTPQSLAQRLQAPHVRLACHVHEFVNGEQRMYQLYHPSRIPTLVATPAGIVPTSAESNDATMN